MRRLALFALILLFALSALLSPRALAQGTLDQSNTAPAGVPGFVTQGNPLVGAQTFTAGITGLLDSASLDLVALAPGTTATVGVYATTGAVPNAVPTGTALASTTITVTQATPPTSAAQYTLATFSAPASVIAGQVYALVLGPVLGPPLAPIAWLGALTNPYAAGNTAGSPTGTAGPYTAGPTSDVDFQTFVTPPAPVAAPVVIVVNPPVTLGIAIKGHGSLTPPAFTLVNQLQAIPVRAVPDPGSVFVGWTGGPCNGTAINPCDIAPNGTTLIIATFAP